MSKYMDLLAKVQQVSCTLFLPLDLSQVLSTTMSLETLTGGVKSTASELLPNLGLALLQGLLLTEVGRGGGERESGGLLKADTFQIMKRIVTSTSLRATSVALLVGLGNLTTTLNTGRGYIQDLDKTDL